MRCDVTDIRHPITGERLTAREHKRRVAFFDVQLSAPKDVSVLAMVGGDERVRDAFTAATGLNRERRVTIEDRGLSGRPTPSVFAREQRIARRRAGGRRGVGVREPTSAGREAVEIWCRDRGCAVTANVAETKVVCENHDDIRRRRRRSAH